MSSSGASDSRKVTKALKNNEYKKMVDAKVEQHKNSEKRLDELSVGSRGSRYISRGSTHETRMKDRVIDHPAYLAKAKHPIIRICLTGGPCAGKTTALATLNQVLAQLGFRVLLVPEAATLLMKGGAMIQTHKLSL